MKTRGFTLIELLVVLAIAAVLATLAAPPLMRQVQQARINSGVNTFLADMRFARGEAIRRGGNVTLCRSDAPEAALPACATGPQGIDWVSGWVIFQDGNNNNVINANETILRVQGRLAGLDSVLDSRATTTVIDFTPTGRLRNLNSARTLYFGGSAFATDIRREVCVSVGGRAIAPAGGCP